MRRLLIDGQLFHTPAWHRGMGKYSLELLKALLNENKTSNQWGIIDIVLSSKYEQDNDMLDLLGSLKGVIVHQLAFEKNRSNDPLNVLEQNRKVIDKYIENLPEHPDDIDYVMLSLMQSEISPAFPSDEQVHKGLLYYDLIPLMFDKTYLSSPVTQKEYLSKVSELVRADIYFGISKTVANDISLYLGIDPKRVVSIDGGGVEHSKVSKKYTVRKPFILMPTGNDLRKNNRRGIEAFKQFNKQHNDSYTLVITSSFKEEEQAELQKLSSEVVFTGNINGEELNYLYEESTALLFPSEYEGLGMPILEAMGKGKPVACSDIAVFREITKTAVSYFNPLRVNEMAEAINKAVFSQPDIKEYKQILTKYNWQRTAKIFAETLSNPPTLSGHAATKINVVTPNPQVSRIGKIAQLSHAELSRSGDVDYYIGDLEGSHVNRPNVISQIGYSSSVLSIISHTADSPVIYYFDGSELSAHTLMVALSKPGIVVLSSQDARLAWKRLVTEGLASDSRLNLEATIDKKIGQEGLLSTLISRQKAVITFDSATAEKIRSIVKKTKASTKVYCFEAPSNEVRYADVFPDKTEKISAADIIKKADMEYEDLISRALEVDYKNVESNEKPYIEVEAAKYQTEAKTLYNYKSYARNLIEVINDIYSGASA